MSKINEINKTNEIEGKQLIVINGRKWQCDDLPATIHAAGKGGLLLQEPEPRALLVQPVEQEEIVARKGLFEEVSAIAAAVSMPLAVAFLAVEDWNKELSPWTAPAVFGKQDFGAGAEETLKSIEAILPALKSHCALAEDAPVVLGGYSLAALFSLWSAYESTLFDAIAAASPSVWFPGWLD